MKVATLAFLIIGMCVALIAAGACGGGEDPTNTPQPTSTPTAMAEQPSPTAMAEQTTEGPTPEPAATSAPDAPTAVPPTAVPTATTEPAMMMEPVVNRLVVAVSLEREGNDPTLIGSTVNHAQLMPAMETLTWADTEGGYQPMLAESWTQSADSQTFNWKLREGVPFHQGCGEFSAKDLVHTLERVAREESQEARGAQVRDLILPDLEVVSEYEVIYNVKQPFLDLVQRSSTWATWLMQSKTLYDEEGEDGIQNNLIGTGPYQLLERSSGEGIVFERVPYDHWRIKPDFPELELRFIEEPAVRLSAILTDEVHIGKLPLDLERTAIDNGMDVLPSTLPAFYVFQFLGGQFYHPDVVQPPIGVRKGEHPDLPYSDVYHGVEELPWADVRVRQALNQAIDRDAINNSLLFGLGEPNYLHWFHKTLSGYNPEWETTYEEKYGYDPEKAKALIEEVEAELGRPLDWSGTRHVVTPGYGYPGLADIAEAINSDWRKIGVEIKIDTREFADFIKDILRGSLGGSTWAGNGGYDESPNRIGYHFYSGRTLAGVCCHYFEHEVMDDNYEAFVESTDPAEQDRLLREAGDVLYNEYGSIPLFWIPATWAVNPNVVAEYVTRGFLKEQDFEYVKAVTK